MKNGYALVVLILLVTVLSGCQTKTIKVEDAPKMTGAEVCQYVSNALGSRTSVAGNYRTILEYKAESAEYVRGGYWNVQVIETKHSENRYFTDYNPEKRQFEDWEWREYDISYTSTTYSFNEDTGRVTKGKVVISN